MPYFTEIVCGETLSGFIADTKKPTEVGLKPKPKKLIRFAPPFSLSVFTGRLRKRVSAAYVFPSAIVRGSSPSNISMGI